MITDVIQKALIKVDEEGTVAAAATAVLMPLAALAPMQPKPPKVFNADHPFMYTLYDIPSQTILFIGQVINPRK